MWTQTTKTEWRYRDERGYRAKITLRGDLFYVEVPREIENWEWATSTGRDTLDEAKRAAKEIMLDHDVHAAQQRALTTMLEEKALAQRKAIKAAKKADEVLGDLLQKEADLIALIERREISDGHYFTTGHRTKDIADLAAVRVKIADRHAAIENREAA